MNYFTNINRSAAGLVVACSLALGGPANQAADAPAAARAPSALTKDTGVPEGESAHPREQPALQALELLGILQTAESLGPLDWEQRLACLARAARRFPASEDVARHLFRSLGSKPQILSAEFDPVDGHIVRMVTQDTVVRTDAKLAPIPDWVLEFAEARAGEFTRDRTVEIDQRVLESPGTDVWTRQAKSALAERMAAARDRTSFDQPASGLGWETYTRTCAACHGPDGRGIRGTAPRLAGSDWVLTPEPQLLVRVALQGLRGPIRVRGEAFGGKDSACLPWRDLLSDGDLAGTLTYIRSNRFWGHALSPVSAAEIRTIREATKTRAKPWTAAELLNPPLLGPDADPQPPIAKPNEYE
jgi:mono/diheme cytochrome c family protein